MNKLICNLKGNGEYSDAFGSVCFTKTNFGVLVETKIYNLKKENKECSNDFMKMHIHKGENCILDKNNKYINVYKHYDTSNCEHPMHKGDLLPIIKNTTFIYSNVLYTKFTLEEICNNVVILHDNKDDLKETNIGFGRMIMCGKIIKLY